jgi:hypothetical protein
LAPIQELGLIFSTRIFRQMKRIIYLVLLSLVFLGCEKTNDFSIDLSGITTTDALGNVVGNPDPSDWAFDNEWTETEKSFFLSDPVDLSESKQASIVMLPLYPNPVVNRVATFNFTSTDTSFVKVAIVNEKLQRLAFFTLKISPGLNAFSIPFPESVFPANSNYRLYYSFDTFSNPGYYKGHGDISIK